MTVWSSVLALGSQHVLNYLERARIPETNMGSGRHCQHQPLVTIFEKGLCDLHFSKALFTLVDVAWREPTKKIELGVRYRSIENDDNCAGDGFSTTLHGINVGQYGLIWANMVLNGLICAYMSILTHLSPF